ncbi:MAG: hypothetical protein ACTHNN_19435 [Xanthobacteraceae bacterium]
MGNPWDIPYAKKFKFGNSDGEVIFLAVGKALSKWEGLIADLTSVFAVLTAPDEPWNYNPAVRAFGTVQGATAKSEMVQQAAEALFHNFERQLYVDCGEIRDELKGLLKEYNGWSGRRNDIAHGYVTEHRLPNYADDGDGELITTFLLLPSHSASRKWPMDWEPAYQYLAEEIEKFGEAFDGLANRIRAFSEKLESWKIETIRANPL